MNFFSDSFFFCIVFFRKGISLRDEILWLCDVGECDGFEVSNKRFVKF